MYETVEWEFFRIHLDKHLYVGLPWIFSRCCKSLKQNKIVNKVGFNMLEPKEWTEWIKRGSFDNELNVIKIIGSSNVLLRYG